MRIRSKQSAKIIHVPTKHSKSDIERAKEVLSKLTEKIHSTDVVSVTEVIKEINEE